MPIFEVQVASASTGREERRLYRATDGSEARRLANEEGWLAGPAHEVSEPTAAIHRKIPRAVVAVIVCLLLGGSLMGSFFWVQRRQLELHEHNLAALRAADDERSAKSAKQQEAALRAEQEKEQELLDRATAEFSKFVRCMDWVLMTKLAATCQIESTDVRRTASITHPIEGVIKATLMYFDTSETYDIEIICGFIDDHWKPQEARATYNSPGASSLLGRSPRKDPQQVRAALRATWNLPELTDCDGLLRLFPKE